jgi:hypothetical protein
MSEVVTDGNTSTEDSLPRRDGVARPVLVWHARSRT